MRQTPECERVEALRFAMTRYLSRWLDQPRRCAIKTCRRTKDCFGEAPDCWSNEPRPTPEEIEVAKGLWRYHLRTEVEARGGDEE